jgi:hypothetical protein
LPLSSSPFHFLSGLWSDLPVAVLKCWCGQKERLVFALEPVRIVQWLLREWHGPAWNLWSLRFAEQTHHQQFSSLFLSWVLVCASI